MTSAFGGQRSIQLSYECIFDHGWGNSYRHRAKIRINFFYTDFAPLPRGKCSIFAGIMVLRVAVTPMSHDDHMLPNMAYDSLFC